MAKEYAYYIEGNKVAIVERDTAFNNDLTSHEFGPGVVRNMWKSPQSSVTDGLEIKYAYSPKYRIESIAAADIETGTSYETADGFLRFNGTSFSTENNVDYIFIEDAGNIEIKEYMMREYKKHIEVYESSLMKGPRIISSGHHAIR